MLAQHKNQSPLFDDLMERVNNIILVLFSVEMLAKILAFQISGYLSDSWNKFDCTLLLFFSSYVLVHRGVPIGGPHHALLPIVASHKAG